MKTDLYTRVLLCIIVLCLIFNVLKVIGIIPDAYADSSQSIVPATNLLSANEDGSLNVRLRASDVIKIEPASGARFKIEPTSGAEFKIKPVSGADFSVKPASYTNFRIYNSQSDASYVRPGSNAVFNVKQSGQSTHVPVIGVSFKSDSVILEEDDYYKIIAYVSPSNATDNSVEWHSSNPSVATIDAQGNIVAYTIGTTVIRVTTVDGGFSATCVVEVVEEKGIVFIHDISPTGSGKVDGSSTGRYMLGSSIAVKAIPNDGYEFKHWLMNGDVVSSNIDYSFTITTKTILTAVFSLRTDIKLTVIASPSEGGEVKGAGVYVAGEFATLVAKPHKDYVFRHWEINGDIVYTESLFLYQVLSDVELVAVFEKEGTNSTELFSGDINITAYGGTLTIRSDKVLAYVAVHTVNGLCLYRSDAPGNEVKISGMPKGLLIVTIDGETRKVMMN